MSNSLDPTPGQAATDFYTMLAPELAAELRARAERIRQRESEAVEAIIEIGNELLAVKERLQHDQFIKWVEAEIEIPPEVTRKVMALARLPKPTQDLACVAVNAQVFEAAQPELPKPASVERPAAGIPPPLNRHKGLH